MTTSLASHPVLTVRRHAPVLVAPAKPTPKELKQLSDIDYQIALRIQVPVLMLYSDNSSMAGKDPVEVIKGALAKALVDYYPLAGKLVEGPNEKLFVDCTSEGVLFVEADTEDTKLDEVVDMIESGREPYFEELLHDAPGSSGILGCPLLLFQVTRFKCGGFTLGLRFNHTVIDGSGLGQFLHAIAEYARGATTLSCPPVWQRDCFLAREPPSITCQHLEFGEIENVSPETTAECKNNIMVSRSFYFGPEEIRALKNLIQDEHGKTYTTFEVVTACLWRCRTRALKPDPNQIVELSILANGRYKNDIKVPPGYYGNVIASPSVVTKSATLCTNPLGYAAELVKQAKAKMSREFLRSTRDHIAINQGQSEYWTTWKFVASDNRGLGADEVDFGWGKPLLGGPVGGNFLVSFYLRYKDGVIAPMCLPQAVMDRFRHELREMLNRDGMQDFVS